MSDADPDPPTRAELEAAPAHPRSLKQARRHAAMDAEVNRLLRRLSSISMAMMRADAAWQAYHEGWGRVLKTGATPDELIIESNRQVERVENTEWLRASAHQSMWFALLYVVVEEWGNWGFHDPHVDPLLTPEHRKVLQDYRHSIFHQAEFDDSRTISFMLTQLETPWADEIGNAIRVALRGVHANLHEWMSKRLVLTFGEKSVQAWIEEKAVMDRLADEGKK